MILVLIETYWNVNTKGGDKMETLKTVLIETYWNVNPGIISGTTKWETSLNRNILECKSPTTVVCVTWLTS